MMSTLQTKWNNSDIATQDISHLRLTFLIAHTLPCKMYNTTKLLSLDTASGTKNALKCRLDVVLSLMSNGNLVKLFRCSCLRL